MAEDTEDKKNIFGTSKLGQALANSEGAAIGFDVGMKVGNAAFDTLSAATGFERDSVDAVADTAADVAGQFGPWGKCICKGTRVVTRTGKIKNIEDVHVGDILLGFDGEEITEEPVVHVFEPYLDDCIEIKLTNGYSLKCNKKHPIYARIPSCKTFEFIKANDLQPRDTVCIVDFELHPTESSVKVIKTIDKQMVYNIETGNSHTYLANFIVTHNCAALAIKGLNAISKATGEKYAEQDLNTGSSGFADFSTEGKQFRGNPLNPLAAFTKSGASASYEQQMERQRKKFAQAKSVVQEQEKEIKARQQAMDNTNQRVKNQLSGGQNYDAILSKDGSKLYPVNNFTPITDYAQDFFNSQTQTVASYKDGGSIIPDGELHKNRHNIEAVRPELEGQITHKGIPVITEEEDPKTGDIKVTQHAEIECGEVILELSITKKLEKLYKEGTDEAAIEAGRILAKELITNTEDNTGELLDGYQD